jgi:hypothetical protein
MYNEIYKITNVTKLKVLKMYSGHMAYEERLTVFIETLVNFWQENNAIKFMQIL